jgi:predicted dehydrogenase
MNHQRKTVRVGLLGAGNVVEAYHLPVLRDFPGVEIAWVYDKNLTRARELAGAAGIRQAADSLENVPDVDAVLVAIPVGGRRAALETVIARGWHAFCEKPFAPTLADHQWITAEARKRGVRLGIGLVRRHYASTRTARRLLESEVLGPIETLLCGDGTSMRRSGRGSDFYQASAQASGGGALAETGSHLVDQAFTICNVEGYTIDRCVQKHVEGLEFETSVRGTINTRTGRAPFALVVSRLADVYTGIVVRCHNGQMRVGLAPDGAVDLCARDGRVIERVGTPGDTKTGLFTAVRAEWEEFFEGCVRSPQFNDWDTGLMTTAFVEECYRHGATSGAPRGANGKNGQTVAISSA